MNGHWPGSVARSGRTGELQLTCVVFPTYFFFFYFGKQRTDLASSAELVSHDVVVMSPREEEKGVNENPSSRLCLTAEDTTPNLVFCHVNIYFQETLHYLLYCYCSHSSSFPTENPDNEQRALVSRYQF